MDNLRNFDLLRSSDLWISRPRFFHRFYELTDGQFCYGIIDDAKDFLGIANDHWTFKKDEEWHGKTALVRISNSRNERIGSVTFHEVTKDVIFKMKNGFEATMIRKRYLGITKAFTWTNTTHGDLVTIRPSIWTTKLRVSLNTDLIKKDTRITLDDLIWRILSHFNTRPLFKTNIRTFLKTR